MNTPLLALALLLAQPPDARGWSVSVSVTVSVRRANPAPAPAPAVAAGKCHVVVIEETAEATARRGVYLAHRDLAGYVRGKGWRVRVADKDAVDATGRTPADLAPYVARAKGRVPYVLVVAEEGRLLHEGSLPATPAELLAVLRRIGG